MYVYMVEYMKMRVVFKTCEDAERFVELMDADGYAEIKPCLVHGGCHVG